MIDSSHLVASIWTGKKFELQARGGGGGFLRSEACADLADTDLRARERNCGHTYCP